MRKTATREPAARETTPRKTASLKSATRESAARETTTPPSLNGIFGFFKELSRNNDREWFAAHKGEYLEIKAKVEALIAWLLPQMVRFDRDLALTDPKKCMYRIYRDIRFSPDKRPYKEYIGIGISKKGRHGICSGYYIQLEPGASFFGAGVYGLPPESLKKVRDGIYFDSARLKKILSSSAVKKYYGGELAAFDKMKLPPKGYDKDFPDMELLKHRHYFLEHTVRDREVYASDFAQKLLDGLKAASEFNRFLNEALEF